MKIVIKDRYSVNVNDYQRKIVVNKNICIGLASSYRQASLPLSEDNRVIVRQGTLWKEANLSDVRKNVIYVDDTPTTWLPNAIYFVRNTGQIWQTDGSAVPVLYCGSGESTKSVFLNLGKVYYTSDDYVDSRWISVNYVYGHNYYNISTNYTDDQVLQPASFYPSVFGIGKKIKIKKIRVFANGFYGETDAVVKTRVTAGDPVLDDTHRDIAYEELTVTANYDAVEVMNIDISEDVEPNERVYIYWKFTKNIALWGVSLYIEYEEV